MNVLRNCSELCLGHWLLYLEKYSFLIILFLLISFNVNASDHITTSAPAINITDYFKVMLGLAFVIAFFLACTFLFKRFGNGNIIGRGQMRLVDGLHLGSRERLVLVEIKDKQILLSITPGQINKLDTIKIESQLEKSDA